MNERPEYLLASIDNNMLLQKKIRIEIASLSHQLADNQNILLGIEQALQNQYQEMKNLLLEGKNEK